MKFQTDYLKTLGGVNYTNLLPYLGQWMDRGTDRQSGVKHNAP